MRFLILLALVGCKAEYKSISELSNPIRQDAESRVCTKEEMEMVKTYFDLCVKTTYTSSHCIDRAMVAHCHKNQVVGTL